MSTSSDDKENLPHRTVKWSPPYRRGNVEMPELNLIEVERDAPRRLHQSETRSAVATLRFKTCSCVYDAV